MKRASGLEKISLQVFLNTIRNIIFDKNKKQKVTLQTE